MYTMRSAELLNVKDQINMSEIKEKPPVDPAITKKVNHIKDFFRLCRAFNKKLDAKPKPEWIKKNPYSENALYIPILRNEV